MSSGSKPSSTPIIENAKVFGASLAGIAAVVSIKKSPSHRVGRKPRLPVGAKSAIVLALAHEISEPELDWWDNREGGTPGNRRLISTSNSLSQWLKEAFNIHCQPLPYHVEKGGIFLKDAAALAGLGTIGKNNLLITPNFGPRVRLCALLVDVELEPTGPIDFTPCEGCDMPCRSICPQHAFAGGSYAKAFCSEQMKKDEASNIIFEKSASASTSGVRVKYCRACELACPVGRK